MPVKWIIHITLFLSQLLVVSAFGQEIPDMVVLQASNVTAFNVNEDLPIQCVSGGLVDSKGRLWLNPCLNLGENQPIHLYQFDGRNTHSIQLDIIPEDHEDQAILACQNISGELIGSISRTGQYFFFNPNTNKLRFYKLPEGDAVINFMGITKDQDLIIHASSEEFHYIYIIKKEKLQLLGIVPRSKNLDGSLAIVKNEYLVLTETDLWHMDIILSTIPGKGDNRTYVGKLYRINLLSGIIKEYPVVDFLGNNPTQQFKDQWTSIYLSTNAKGQAILHFKKTNQFFKIDPLTDLISPLDHLPGNISVKLFKGLKLAIKYDQAGNTLFFDRNGKKAILLDTFGGIYDYSKVLITAIKAVNGEKKHVIGKLWSHDFREMIYLFLSGGISVAEIQPEGTIKNYFGPFSIRSISELGPDHYIAYLMNTGKGPRLVEFQKDKFNTPMDIELTNRICSSLGGFKLNRFALIRRDQEGGNWFCLQTPPTSINSLIHQESDGNCTIIETGTYIDEIAFLDSNTILLVGRYRPDKPQLYRYNPKNRQLKPFFENDQSPKIQGKIYDLLISQDSTIWIATINGLWRIDSKKGERQHLSIAQGFQDERMLCLHEDKLGRLWIGTNRGGLHIYDPVSGDISIIDQKKGLSNNKVVGILEDDEGVFWIATNHGMNLVSSKGEVMTQLYQKDGLANNEFNQNSFYKDSQGNLLFGTILGLSQIEPRALKKQVLNRIDQQIYGISITTFHPDIKKDSTRQYGFDLLERVQLLATHRYLNLDFGLSNYILSAENEFAYKIVGNANPSQSEWLSLGNNNELNLSNLPAGRFDILIRGRDYKGDWTAIPLIIPVEVGEFFYKQLWFYLLCMLPFIVFAIIWVRRLRMEKTMLTTKVNRATKKIREDKKLIEQQAERLQELDKMKSRFFTNISHELRTPLTIIRGMVDQMKENPGKWLAKGHKMITRNSDNLLNLVNQILDLRKLESGKLELNLIQSDMVPYLKYIVESFHSLAESKDIQLHFQSDEAEVMMDYDAEKMLRIVSNLLSNAIKFTPEGGDVFIKVTKENSDIKDVSNSQLSPLHPLTIQVRDTGIGIPADKIAHVFDRFYQVDDSSTRSGEGTGIGLALTNELVKLMSGDINVESQPNEGTTFSIKIPISNEAPISKAKEDKTNQNEIASTLTLSTIDELQISTMSPHDSQLPTLLIVEDNTDVVQYLVACLEDQFQLEVARDGQEGVEKAIEQVPDIIISDVMMPRKDGFELCQTLKTDERTSHIPIVLLTAKADQESRISGLERGADAYLTKPFNKQELFVRLKNLLKIRKKLQERYGTLEELAPTQEIAFQQEDEFIGKVRSAIEENLDDESFGIVELCRTVAMSRAQLHRKIKALTTISTSHFIRSIRLIKAKELLRTTDLNVSEIAYEVGFSNPKYFSMVFSDEFDQSPSEFRK